jgi:hypothetical protein
MGEDKGINSVPSLLLSHICSRIQVKTIGKELQVKTIGKKLPDDYNILALRTSHNKHDYYNNYNSGDDALL